MSTDRRIFDGISGVFAMTEQHLSTAQNLVTVNRTVFNGTEDEDVMIIAASGLFNDEWYLKENLDVARSGINPLLHYVRHGAGEMRSPYKGFNAAQYIKNVESKDTVEGKPNWVSRNPLAHFILHGSKDDLLSKGRLTAYSIPAIKMAINRLRAMPIFMAEEYIALNGDIRFNGGDANVEAANHALVYGFPEGRAVFMKTTVGRVMGAAAREPFVATLSAHKYKHLPKLPPIGVFYNASGNAFLQEIAAEIVATLLSCGQDAKLLTDISSIDDRPPICLFVAPHEFFHIGEGSTWAREDVLRNAFMYTTEQPQTHLFERAMPFVLIARAVIDASWQVHKVFRKAGMPACHFNPNIAPSTRWLQGKDTDHPLIRVLPKSAQSIEVPIARFADRCIDLSFFGSKSDHRDKFFAKNATFFSNLEGFLYYRKMKGPVAVKEKPSALSRIAGHVTAHSKISLNVHRDDLGFFEWHRIVKLGMVSGAVVVSEPCDPHPVFKLGVHYLEETGRHILNLVEWLLRTPDGRAHAQIIQNNGLALIRNRDRAVRNSHALVTFISEHYATPSGIIGHQCDR